MKKRRITDVDGLSIWIEQKGAKGFTSSVNVCVSQDEVDDPYPECRTNTVFRRFQGIINWEKYNKNNLNFRTIISLIIIWGADKPD